MADVITQFLVGIGVQYDDAGQKKYEEGMTQSMSTTLRASSVITAAFAAMGATIDNNARAIANTNLQAQRMSVNGQYVLQYGAAISRMGGNADDAIGQLQRMDKIMDDLHVRGQSGTLNELAQAGFDVGYLTQATDAQDLQGRIADQYQHARPDQRRVASDILGIDPATAQLYSGGSDYLKEQVTQAGNLEHITQDLIDKSSQYNLQLRDTQTAWNGLVNTATQHYIPAMTQIANLTQRAFEWTDKFIQNHPEAADNIAKAGVPVAVGGAVATAGSVLTKFGVPGLRTISRVAGPLGVAAGAADVSTPYIVKGLDNLFGDSDYYKSIRNAPSIPGVFEAAAAPLTNPSSNRQTEASSDDSMYKNLSWGGIWDTITGKSSQEVAPSQHAVRSDVPDWHQETNDDHSTHDSSVTTTNNDHRLFNTDYLDHGDSTDNSATYNVYNQHDVQAPTSDTVYEKQARATSQALKETPIQITGVLNANLNLDGTVIDQRIERFDIMQNQHSLNVNSPQVDR